MAKSYAETVLENIRAIIITRTGGDIPESYSISGRDISKIPIEQLIKMESLYASQVANEKAANDIADGVGGNPNKIKTRFI